MGKVNTTLDLLRARRAMRRRREEPPAGDGEALQDGETPKDNDAPQEVEPSPQGDAPPRGGGEKAEAPPHPTPPAGNRRRAGG